MVAFVLCLLPALPSPSGSSLNMPNPYFHTTLTPTSYAGFFNSLPPAPDEAFFLSAFQAKEIQLQYRTIALFTRHYRKEKNLAFICTASLWFSPLLPGN